MKRQFTDDQLRILAAIFHIDTGDAFKPITDEEIAEKVEKIFPREKTEAIKTELNAKIEKLFRKGAEV